MKVRLSPSMMCADIFTLKGTLETMEKEGVELLHMDVMDGHFVPNYMLGTDYIKRMRKGTSIPMDIHMMVEEPGDKLEWFGLQEGDVVSVHAESTIHLQRVLKQIRDFGASPAVAINPATPLAMIEEILPDIDMVLLMTVNPGFSGQKMVPQTLDKISRLRKMLDERGYDNVSIEVDGNVSIENARKMRAAGADTFVLGTSCLFNDNELAGEIKKFRNEIA